MDLSVVIVNYRVKYFLEQTLHSVLVATAGIQTEIFVVDNASGDGSMDYVMKQFPSLHYILNKQNVGFARANNQAISQAQGRYTLILNPDTIITEQCIRECINWMHQHESCGAIGLHMIDGHGKFLPESKRAFPTPWVSFCKIFGLSALRPNSPWLAKYHLRYLNEWQPHQIDILSGAAMFCRTSLLQQLGGFDEDFFMYGEDIDLSYRIVKAGYTNQYLPVSMIHYKGESTNKHTRRYIQVFYTAMLIFYRKHFPRFRTLVYPLIKCGVAVRVALARLQQICGKTSITSSEIERYVIISQKPKRVSDKLRLHNFTTNTENLSKYDCLVIDDATNSYDQIVKLIEFYANSPAQIAIFAHRPGILISPKMTVK